MLTVLSNAEQIFPPNLLYIQDRFHGDYFFSRHPQLDPSSKYNLLDLISFNNK
jgi:hypothetical protein